MRHTELNTDIVTWTRLFNRGAPTVGAHSDTTSSPMAVLPERPTKSGGHSDSPPSSPLNSHSGGSTPKSPNTPSDLEQDEGPPINGELPPPIPINEEDLAPSSRINDHPIIPPPREFLGSAEEIARRRASEGSMAQSPGHAPAYLHSEGVHPMSPNRHQHHQGPHQYHHQSPQHSSNMATGREVGTIWRSGVHYLEFDNFGWFECALGIVHYVSVLCEQQCIGRTQ